MNYPLPALGVDLSLANLGLAWGHIAEDGEVSIHNLRLMTTKKSKVKSLRKSADDLDRTSLLWGALKDACEGNALAMVEMPVGSQNSRAMMSYGLAIALVAAMPIPVIQLTPRQVKEASFGDKDAAKEDMINWATKLYPDAPWLIKKDGSFLNKNEHLADAVACLHAGARSEDYERAVSMMTALAA